MEEVSTGKTCEFEGCAEFDFLPATCVRCKRSYCHAHFENHGCEVGTGEDRRVAGAVDGSSGATSSYAKKPCSFCGKETRHLIACGEGSCQGQGNLFCLEHRHHAVHSGEEKGGLVRHSTAATQSSAAQQNRTMKLRSETLLLGTRRNFPLRVGRFPPGFSSAGTSVALIVPSWREHGGERGGGSAQKKGISGGGLNAEQIGGNNGEPHKAVFSHTTTVPSSSQEEGDATPPVTTPSLPRSTKTVASTTYTSSADSPSTTLTVSWEMCFAALAQGSSLGNMIDCLDLKGIASLPTLPTGGATTSAKCIIARSGTTIELVNGELQQEEGGNEAKGKEDEGRKSPSSSSSSSSQLVVAPAEIPSTLSLLVQDAMNGNSLLVVIPQGLPTGMHDHLVQTAKVRVLQRAAKFLVGYYQSPQVKFIKSLEIPAKEGKQVNDGDGQASTKQGEEGTQKPEDATTSSDSDEARGGQGNFFATLKYPLLTEHPFSASGPLKAIGRDQAKGSTGQQVCIAVFSLIPFSKPTPTTTSSTTGGGAPPPVLVSIPPAFTLWVSDSWPHGKVIDRIAMELRGTYDLAGATNAFIEATSTAATTTPTSAPKGIPSLGLYNLQTGCPVASGTKLVNKDIIGVYLNPSTLDAIIEGGGNGSSSSSSHLPPLLPVSIQSQLKPLIELGGPKNVPKQLKTKMMKDCCIQ